MRRHRDATATTSSCLPRCYWAPVQGSMPKRGKKGGAKKGNAEKKALAEAVAAPFALGVEAHTAGEEAAEAGSVQEAARLLEAGHLALVHGAALVLVHELLVALTACELLLEAAARRVRIDATAVGELVVTRIDRAAARGEGQQLAARHLVGRRALAHG